MKRKRWESRLLAGEVVGLLAGGVGQSTGHQTSNGSQGPDVAAALRAMGAPIP